MRPAPRPNDSTPSARLMVLDPHAARGAHVTMDVLPELLGSEDVVVVNEAGTLPGSVQATTGRGEPVELRLVSTHPAGLLMVAMGAGDWRMDTDVRPPPPALRVGDRLALAHGSSAVWEVAAVDARSPRLLTLRGGGTTPMLLQLCQAGAPVQYAYTDRALAPHEVQTPYGSVPWAVEMPSAGRTLTVPRLTALRERGVTVCGLLHAAGLSATGDAALDALLPLPERFHIPLATVRAIERARSRGGRVVAVGTSVVRALEGAVAQWGTLRSGEGWTDLILTPAFVPRVVDGLLSGMHDRGSSHFRLLGAWLPEPALDAMLQAGEAADYRVHEFGDHMLVLPGVLAEERADGFCWWGGMLCGAVNGNGTALPTHV